MCNELARRAIQPPSSTMSYEHELTHEQDHEYSEFKAEISVKYESKAKACRGRRTEHTPSAGGRPRRSETRTLIASSAVSTSPGVAPAGRRVRTRVEGVCDNSCLPRSPPTTANFSADELIVVSFQQRFSDTPPYFRSTHRRRFPFASYNSRSI